MGTLASAKNLAEAALRRVGSYAPKDTGADPDHLDIALASLDRAVKELAGTDEWVWLVPHNTEVPVPAATTPLDLLNLSSEIAINTFQFLLDAKIKRTTGTVPGSEGDLTILSRRGYNDIPDKDASGYPDRIYVDRTVAKPFAYLWPVPADDSFTLVLTYQSYALDQTANKGIGETGLDEAWERWGDYQTAADIGDGPVARMPSEELVRWERKAEQARTRLFAFHNRQGNRPRRTKFKDL